MSWFPSVHAALLFTASGLCVWAAVLARGRSARPGLSAFAWLMLAVAHWSLTSALHAVVPSQDVRVGLSMLQYIGISAVPPLWFLFASDYGRARWTADNTLRGLLWLIPALNVVLAFTNPWHGMLWSAVVPVDGGARLVYQHGPWFWVALTYNYVLLLMGTVLLVRALRRFPVPRRRQHVLIMLGALLPWAGNVVYVLRLLPVQGLDITPIAFTASGTLILWGLQRHRLLGIVPIARDLVVDNMDDAVIVLDQQRTILDLNPAAVRLIGAGDDAIGLPVEKAVPWWTGTASGAGTEQRPAVVSVGPEPKYFEVDIRPVRDAQQRFAGWLMRIRDITARRHADAERQRLERRMQEQQRLESLSVLAGGVAHDFNNLLTGILGNADLLSMQAGPGTPMRRSADAIILGAQRAADLVSQMLAYAGEGQVVAEVVSLNALIEEMLDLLRASVARHCELVYEADGELPPIKVDATQVRQIVLNLIVNAAEAVPDGANITVRTGSAALTNGDLSRKTFSATASPGLHVFVEVSDNGPGMSAATLARVFDPFFSTKSTGRGLGLAAVQGIVRGHRGAIEVVTQPGIGTRFRVWLPVTAAPLSKPAGSVREEFGQA